METTEIKTLIQNIIADRGVPRRIKDSLEESLGMLGTGKEPQENIAQLITVLDDASSNPNLSMNARTHIWNIVSALEQENSR